MPATGTGGHTPLSDRIAYACQTWLQCWHVVGLRPASNDSNPRGKKQIDTMICHV
ncbi:MAG: hypothetical protein WCG22_03700 [Lentisphaerota bacterium]